jgi:hypothetical protein
MGCVYLNLLRTRSVSFMISSLFVAISVSLAFVFFIMWIRERRAALRAEVVAYGLRAQDDQDEDTKTDLIIKNQEYSVAIKKLEQMGQIQMDSWGRWVWTDSGQLLGR